MNISIYEYIDYKKYLTDWRIAEKRKNPGLTHEYLCCVLHQKNRSFYNDIEKGRKKIGKDIIDQFIKLLKLHKPEDDYFRAIVNYGQSSSSGDKEFWFEQIISINNTPKKIIDKETLSYFSQWWHSAVRSILDTFTFSDNYKLLAHKLFNRITPTQAQNSIKLLAHLGLIEKNNSGFWKPTDKILSTGDNVKDECLHRYQLANLDILRLVLEENCAGTFDSSNITVSVSRKGLQRIINSIRKVRSEIISIAHKDDETADRVYNIALHAYPISRND